MQKLLSAHLTEIREACRRRHVANLYVFGSALTDRFRKGSDVDFLVEFEPLLPEDYADNYFDLCDDLEAILRRKVDLVTLPSVKNPYFKNEVFKTRQLIFEHQA